MQQGTWSQEEHDRFLAGLKLHPDGPWRMIARYVGTRSVRQVQTHAQKYHEKIARRMRGLRKDRRNHIRKEHRIDGDVLSMLPAEQSPLADFQFSPIASYQGLHATTLQFPIEEHDHIGIRFDASSIHLPPLRLAMPSLALENEQLPEEPLFNYFARASSYDTSAPSLIPCSLAI
jgi:SHAQKYF class myb-like DNA-binding protein